ncbi:MAG: zinc-binding dehydrogenase [Nitrospirae bacterium]|nr:zinc-binding dehydrogenase [Nitrospirota bacterium]
MRAALLVEPGRIEIAERDTPKPSRGEVLIKVRAALTCGTDLKAFLRGHHAIPMPGVFGHEFSGTIEEAGKEVKRWKPGDEVMAVHSAPCRSCRYCGKKLFHLCENIMSTKVLGAFADYVLLPAHIVKQNLFRKPTCLSFEEAAILEPLSCVTHGMAGLRIGRGNKVLIIGAGPIGLLHLLTAKMKRAEVIVTGLEKERLKLAAELGADRAVAPGELPETVKEFSGGMGVDFVFECTGRPAVWEDSVKYLRRGGTTVLFGGCKSGTKVTYDTFRLHYDEITLRGVFHFTPRDVRAAYELMKGKISVSPLISGRYPLRELQIPFEKLTRGEGVKYAVIP